MLKNSGKRGSTLIIAIIFTAVLTTLAGGVLARVVHERTMMQGSVENSSLLYVAEGYADKAIWSVNNSDWSGYESVGNGNHRYLPFEEVNMGNRSVWVHVFVEDALMDNRTIYAEAVAQLPNGRLLERQVRVRYTASTQTSIPGGMIAKDLLDFSGQGAFDAYDSSKGPPDPIFNRLDQVTIATTSTGSDKFKMSGQVDIFGFAGTGRKNPSMSGQIKILGEDSATSEERKGTIDWARIFNDFKYEFPPIVQPSWTGALKKYSKNTLGQDGKTTIYKLDKLEPDKMLTVRGDVKVYLENGMSIGGQGRIKVTNGSSIEVYTPKDVTVSGQAIVNDAGRPGNFKIFGTVKKAKDQTVSLSGDGVMEVVVYAPYGKINVSGSGDFRGSVIGYEMTFSGNSAFHYDVSLGGTRDTNGNPRVTSWHDMSRSPVDLEGEIKKAGGSYVLPL